MKRDRLPRSRRITSSADYARIYRGRVRAADRSLLVYAAANPNGLTRFGLSVSKKHGNAVKRVRLKRLLREAFRLSQRELPTGLNLILIPQQDIAPSATLADFQKSLVELASRLSKRLGSIST